MDGWGATGEWNLCTFAGAGTDAACATSFKADSTHRTYPASVQYCQTLGMAVASIHTQQENDEVQKMITTTSYRAIIIPQHAATSFRLIPAKGGFQDLQGLI